jgi:hypothetical protein
VAAALRDWITDAYTVQHYHALQAKMHIALYRGDYATARALFDEDWPRLRRSFLARMRTIGADLAHLRGRIALLEHERTGRAERLEEVERACRGLRRAGTTMAEGLAEQLLAAVAHARQQPEATRQHLGRALALYEGSGLAVSAAVARMRMGALAGDDDGRRLVVEGEATLRAAGVRSVERMVAFLAPGLAPR